PPLEPERSGDTRKDTQALTQRLAEEFEGLIAAAPEQWHVLSRYFRPEGSGEPQGGAPVDREGSGEPQGDAPAGRDRGAVWLDLEDGAGPEDLEALAALLGDPERPKLAHDAKYLYLAVWARGWELRGLAMDTALAAYLALPAQRTYDLADLALRYLRKELRPEGAGTDERPAGEGTQLALDTTGEDETWPDWCLRAQAVGELAVKLGEELAAMEVGRLVDDVELPLVPILAKLEQTGIAVDLSVLDEIRDRLDARLADYEARVYQLAGEEFNIGSNPQL